MFYAIFSGKKKVSQQLTILCTWCLGLLALPGWCGQVTIAPNRLVSIENCLMHGSPQLTCVEIRQTDETGAFAPTLHLQGDGVLHINATAAEPGGRVLIAGSFRGQLSSNGVTLPATGPQTDLFYLNIEADGTLLTLASLPEPGDQWLYGAAYEASGMFVLQGASRDGDENPGLRLIYLDSAGEALGWDDDPLGDVSAPANSILEEDDEEPIEDPIG